MSRGEERGRGIWRRDTLIWIEIGIGYVRICIAFWFGWSFGLGIFVVEMNGKVL